MYQGRDTAKLGFLAPERLLPDGELGPAADVFSLCALLVFMLSGKPPYAFGDGDDREVVEKGTLLDPGALLAGGVPEVLVNILKKGLRANPDERLVDACELASALERLAY